VSPVRWLLGLTVALIVAAVTWTAPGTTRTAGALLTLDVPTASTGPTPALPWRPGRPQLGVQVYWQDNPADALEVLHAKAGRVFDHVVGIEANSVSISFPFFTDTITASTLHSDLRTPSPQRLGMVVDDARRSGLRVAVRPLLDEANLIAVDSKDWRGTLDPADRDSWFASYRTFLTPYLEMAERHRVQTFVLGAELSVMQDDPRWVALAEYARTVFTGELAYSANWDAVTTARANVPTDMIGIDAYPKLDLRRGTSEAEMLDAWRAWLARTTPGKPTLLYEVGAAAEARTVDNPAVPHRPGTPLDEGTQARWFAAACQAAQDQRLGGLYWWKISFDDEPLHADPVHDRHDSFLGRSAEAAMRECFTSWARSP
jgi:hypothetical protein